MTGRDRANLSSCVGMTCACRGGVEARDQAVTDASSARRFRKEGGNESVWNEALTEEGAQSYGNPSEKYGIGEQLNCGAQEGECRESHDRTLV